MPAQATGRWGGLWTYELEITELKATYRGAEARRFALEPPLYGAGWPEVAYEAQTIFVYVSESSEPGHHFVQLLAYDADGNEVGRKKMGGNSR